MTGHLCSALSIIGMLVAHADKGCPEAVRPLVQDCLRRAHAALVDALMMVATREAPADCDACGGYGAIGDGPCSACDGEGVRRVGA